MITCPGCSRTVKPLAGVMNCPYCGADLPMGGVAAQPAAPSAGHGIAPPPIQPDTPAFPTRMKANRSLLGRVCAGCARNIELGEDVWNCGDCRGTMHSACYDAARSCQFAGCPSAVKAQASAKAAAPAPGGTSVAVGDTKPCPYCREPIAVGAKKCRFCNEYLDPVMRDRMNRVKNEQTDTDDNLSGSEIAFGILCGGIACIVGVVWMIQGKKKGAKLAGLGILSAVIMNLITAGSRHH